MSGAAAGGPLYRLLFTRVLTRLDAERAHELAVRGLRAAGRSPRVGSLVAGLARTKPDPVLAVRALGLTFPSPLGLAAGFDKDAAMVDGLLALGFGSVEVGTVTAHAQPGNPRPRLFRLPEDRALVNRMGFNNAGAAAAAQRLARRPAGARGIVGVNIGKSKIASPEEAPDDYRASAALVAPVADYLVVNVSSPNTPGLRDLQAVAALGPILTAVREGLEQAGRPAVPVLVKIAPDLADEEIDAVADLAVAEGLAGIVATNTTISRDGLRAAPGRVEAAGAGGLSGAPLRARSLEVLTRLRERLNAPGRDIAIISVGGVSDADDVWERMRAGATLVQAYTGFVYGGPLWASRINRDIARRLRTEGGFAGSVVR